MAAAGKQHLVFEVFGKVQRVFFRVHTAEEATRLNLVGFVENTPANTVVGEAVGQPADIEAFRHWLRHTGSPQSQVSDATFTVREADEAHGYTAFDVRRKKKA